MASRDGRLSSRWAWPLLILASTASAFSLSNFQVISSTSVPLGCILAYNSPIPGCSMNDFVKGRLCSAACVRGLTKVQSTLQSACYDINADAATVLGQVLLGNLVALVCPGTSSPDTPVSSPSRSSTAERTTLTVPPTSSRPALTFTTVRPTSTSSDDATETEEPDTSTSTSSSSPTATRNTAIPTFEQSSPPTSASSSSSRTATTPASAEPTPDDSSGGGSPFDVATSGSRQLALHWTAMVAALGLALLFVH